MPSGVKIKRGDGAPAAGADGSGGVWPYELAWDYTNNKLYINDNGTMREIGGGEVSAVAMCWCSTFLTMVYKQHITIKDLLININQQILYTEI